MRIRVSTIQDLRAMAGHLKEVIAEKQRELETIEHAVNVFEANMASGQTHQAGSFTAAVKSAIQDILREEGPLHRLEILQRLESQGLMFTHHKSPVNAVASFLSQTPNVRSDGKGNWHSAEKKEVPSEINET